MRGGIPIQTIESAIRCDTGETLLASDLLQMSEKVFTELRRATWPPTKRPDQPGPQLTFRCTICEAPLSLSRIRKDGETKNRFFIHRRPTDRDCPWLHRNRLTAEQILAMQYFGQHEGERHRRLKNEIADSLRCDPGIETGSVIVDRFQLGKVLYGERKRPDVRGTWQSKPLVFEIQLSYTFISEAVKRDYFYKNEGSYLIWVFPHWMPDRATYIDEEAHNRRNAFVFDAETKAASEASGRLMLRCYCTVPVLNEAAREIEEDSESHLVALSDLTYPEDSKRPYFKDCDVLFDETDKKLLALRELDRLESERQAAEAAARKQRLEAQRRVPAQELFEVQQPTEKTQRHATTAAKHAESLWVAIGNELALLASRATDSEEALDTSGLAAAIERLPNPKQRADAMTLTRYPFLQTAFKLAGIQMNAPLATKFGTVFEMLAASLQIAPSQQNVQKTMAFLYLAAVHAYEPSMRPDHRQKIREREAAHRDESSRDPDLYATDPAFLRTIRLLFPAIARQLDRWEEEQQFRGSPGLVWTLEPDKTKARVVGNRYLSTHRETDWRHVYSEAASAKRSGLTVPSFIELCAAETRARPGDIRNFLVATTLARPRNR